MDTKLNINALNISPYLWWKFIDKALHFANHYSKELFNYNFEEWLNSEFTSDGKVFDIETWDGYKSNIKENKFRDF